MRGSSFCVRSEFGLRVSICGIPANGNSVAGEGKFLTATETLSEATHREVGADGRAGSGAIRVFPEPFCGRYGQVNQDLSGKDRRVNPGGGT